MSVINFGDSLSLREFAHAVATVGEDVTIIGEGETGIGKSSTLKEIARLRPGIKPKYIDCTLLDLGDFALPFTVEENGMKVTRFAPNARFGMQENGPVVIMLDEIGKAMKSVKNVLLTLMLEKRIGDHYLPEGSIVFGTTNLMSDGLGDFLEMHAKNRVAFVKVRKADADGWIEDFAMANDIDPVVIAWVKQFPHCLASYTDPTQADNVYIGNPKRAGQGAFVTPRSLEKASNVTKKRGILGDALTISLLSGTIGEAAARDMQAFMTVADRLPTWDAILANPDTAKLPDDTVAKCILVYGAITRVERDGMGKWMKYVQRMDKEWQALFATSVMKVPSKQAFAVTNKDFRDWAVANQWLF
jgi:hypothetical protein